jgi:hypothetical protein
MTFPIPAPAQQQIVLDRVDMNIAMFKRYADEAARTMRMQVDRIQLVDFFEGRAEFDDLAYSAKQWMQVMPAWGTYGT